MKKRSSQLPPEQDLNQPLFPDFVVPDTGKPRRYKRVGQAIWSDHKAHFIQQYLKYFVQITKHGTYIDGFSGPQYHDQLEAWTASLVLASEPKWLRRFYLCEIDQKSIEALQKLKDAQSPPVDRKGRPLPRSVSIYPGDFNQTIDGILSSGEITQKEATFCLLDQRTFECDWSTLEKIARYKQPPNKKVELLYFLGVGWLHRAISGLKNGETLERWWGRDDWMTTSSLNQWALADTVRKRFVEELGYKFAAAYPIFDRAEGNRIMYYMVHASDHDDAPALMVRAHGKAVRTVSKEVQQELKFIDV